MYTYYLASALGIAVPTSWKRKLTLLQIIQLCSGFAFGAVWMWLHLTEGCAGIGLTEVIVGVAANVVLVAFFINFYRQTYLRPRSSSSSSSSSLSSSSVDITAKHKDA